MKVRLKEYQILERRIRLLRGGRIWGGISASQPTPGVHPPNAMAITHDWWRVKIAATAIVDGGGWVIIELHRAGHHWVFAD